MERSRCSRWPEYAAEVTVRLPRRAHNPILLDAGLIGPAVAIPWWRGRTLRIEIV